jgi:hypothetical protein
MASPREKRTLQDYWNIPFRGLVPGGLNDQKDNPALPKITNPQDAPVMEDDELKDSLLLTEEITCVRRCFYAFQIQVGAVETVQVLGQDTFRHRTLIRNVGPGSVFLGATESIGATGFSLFQSTNQPPLELATTEEVWALQEASQSSNAILHIFVEFDKYDMQVKGL